MALNLFIIVCALSIFTILIYSLVVNCETVKESWVNYKQMPFGNIQTGAGNKDITPLVFYEYPTYRRPYNYPVCHLVDYPIPHCRTDSL